MMMAITTETRRYHMINLLLVVLLAVFIPQIAHASLTQCSLGRKRWNPDAPLRFGLSMSLRKADKASRLGCGLISPDALQLYVAAQWVCERLNTDNGNGSFVPGMTFGFDLLDDCRSTTRAVQYALEYVDLHSECQSTGNSTAQVKLGILGPSRSSTAEATVDAMRNIRLPIVSASATLASLTEGESAHPNFFRTVPSDKLQIKAIVSVLVKLRWTLAVVVHTDDNYGVMGSKLLKAEAAKVHVCINTSIPISSDTVLDSVVSQLYALHYKAESNSLAVVFFGEKDKAENLMFNVRSRRAYGLHFIMSDAVNTNIDVFKSGQLQSGANIALGSFTLAPSSIQLNDFDNYLNSKYLSVKEGREQDEVIKAYVDTEQNLGHVKHISYVPLAVSAIYALAEAARVAHLERCSGVPGACQEFVSGVLEGDMLTGLSKVKVDFGAMSSKVAPRELREQGYVLEFDANGDVVPKPQLPDFTVFAFDYNAGKHTFLQVGTYSGEELVLNVDNVRMMNTNGQVTSEIQTSVCAGNCVECADDGRIPLAHIQGSAYIIGVFSIHERNAEQPFKCGDFRNVSIDAVVLEAFLHTVRQMREQTGIDFGAVAFDDCYSALHITSILSDFLSGLVTYDKNLFEVCVPQDKVVGMVGSLSSDATLAVASFCTPQRIPTISYAASSPDLDDTINYPFFLRTVPSDEEQAVAMAQLIKAMGWQHVGLLSVANNYGTKGAQAFRRVAYMQGICVAADVSISVNPTNVDEKHLYDAFVALVQQSVKVVVFFGIDTRMADFLRLIESRGEQGNIVFIASEEWGTKADVLAAGPKAARGSITFKVDNTFIDEDTERSLREELLKKMPSDNDTNPWFSEFWQHVFDCNIPGGFNNIFNKECEPNQRLKSSQVAAMMSDQRVKHVMNSVKAMAGGLAAARTQICEDSFPCPFLRSDKYAKEVFDSIKAQTVSFGSTQEELFDDKGNGNIGFKIYNIQRMPGTVNSYAYKEVGQYSKKNGLSLAKEQLVFYKDTGVAQDKLDAPCTDDLCPVGCIQTNEVLPTPAPVEKTDREFRVADLVIIIVLLVIFLVVICGLIIGFNYFRKKVRGLSKELQEQKNEPVYHMANSPRRDAHYGNLQSPNRMMSLPLPEGRAPPIHFVNGGLSSCSNSPADTLEGHTNRGFVSETTLNGGTPFASETSLHPGNGRRGPVPPPPPPPRSPAPPFHHSMSAAPRIEHSPSIDNSTRSSSQHNYYMAHSISSHRELPQVPGQESEVSPATRALRSLHSMPADTQSHRSAELEEIALQNLGQWGNNPASLSRDDVRFTQAAGLDPSLFTQNEADNPGHVQYFRMTPSGELEEENEEEALSAINTYTLSSPDEDRSTLNTYSLSPPTTRSVDTSGSTNPDTSPDHYPGPEQTSQNAQHDRSGSQTPVSYSRVVLPRQRSDSANGPLPPTMYSGVIPPLQITPEMRAMLLQQLLANSYHDSSGSGNTSSYGVGSGTGDSSMQSPYSTSGRESTTPSSGASSRLDQRQGPGHHQLSQQLAQQPAQDPASSDVAYSSMFPSGPSRSHAESPYTVQQLNPSAQPDYAGHSNKGPGHHQLSQQLAQQPAQDPASSAVVYSSMFPSGPSRSHAESPYTVQQLNPSAQPDYAGHSNKGYSPATEGGHAGSVQTGVYASMPQSPQHFSPAPALSQIADMPQTDLSQPPQSMPAQSKQPVGGGNNNATTYSHPMATNNAATSEDVASAAGSRLPVNWTVESLQSYDEQDEPQQRNLQQQQQQQQQQQLQEQQPTPQQQQHPHPQQLTMSQQPHADLTDEKELLHSMQLNISRV